MPIRIKHDVNPSVALSAQFAAGEAGQRKQAEVAGLQAMERRKTREDMQQFRSDETLLAHERDLERMEAGAGLENEQFEFRLTAQQKARQEQLQNALQDVMANDDFDPDQTAQAADAIKKQIADATQPIPFRKEPMPTLADKLKKNLVRDKETGKLFRVKGRDKDGTEIFDEVQEGPTYNDKIAMRKALKDEFFNTVTGVTDREGLEAAYRKWLEENSPQRGGGGEMMQFIRGKDGRRYRVDQSGKVLGPVGGDMTLDEMNAANQDGLYIPGEGPPAVSVEEGGQRQFTDQREVTPEGIDLGASAAAAFAPRKLDDERRVIDKDRNREEARASLRDFSRMNAEPTLDWFLDVTRSYDPNARGRDDKALTTIFNKLKGSNWRHSTNKGYIEAIKSLDQTQKANLKVVLDIIRAKRDEKRGKKKAYDPLTDPNLDLGSI